MTASEAASILGPGGRLNVRTEPGDDGPIWIGQALISDVVAFEARHDELARVLIDLMAYMTGLAAAAAAAENDDPS